jgi:hypothetical protein
MHTKKLAAVIAALALAGVTTAPAAFAGPPDPSPKGKCNSGKGNASETDPANDCDPGNSGGHNNGGD